MKSLHTLYFSPTETTKRTVSAIADGIGNVLNTYDITLPQNRVTTPVFGQGDLVIIGMPVYAGRLPILIDEYIKKMKGENTLVVLVVAYGNREYDDALIEMKDIFSSNGFIPIAAGAFIGEHSYTKDVGTMRPDQEDIFKAKAFGIQIREILKSDMDFQERDLKVKGKAPYRKRNQSLPLGPTVSENCTKCGICIEHCPAGALVINDSVQVNHELCIRCHSCVKRCSQKSIDFDERLHHVRRWLENNCRIERKEPELFFM